MDKEELLQKLKALAERGVGGEKENAEAMLKKLCAKFGINEEALAEEKNKRHEITWRNIFEKKLVGQIVYAMFGDVNPEKEFRYYRGVREGYICCTDAEFIEFQAKFGFYRYHLKKDMEIFYSAFVQKNHLYPPKHLTKPGEDDCEIPEDYYKMLAMTRGMEKHDYNLQIEDKKDDN